MNIDTSDQYNHLDQPGAGSAAAGSAQCTACGGRERRHVDTAVGQRMMPCPDCQTEAFVAQAALLEPTAQPAFTAVALATAYARVLAGPKVAKRSVPAPPALPPAAIVVPKKPTTAPTVIADHVQIRRSLGVSMVRVMWHLEGSDSAHVTPVPIAHQHATSPRDAADALDSTIMTRRTDIATAQRELAVMIAAAAWLRGR